MGLNKVKIGDLIEKFNQKCRIPNLTVDDVSGINRDKEFFEPSKQVGKDTENYKIVPPGYFACNLMHVGRDVVLPIAYNHTDKNKIVSPAYDVFKIKKNDLLLDDYLIMYLKSEQKDRYFWFNTDSSIRDGMDWDTFCDVVIELPDIKIQEKYTKIYKALELNKKIYSKNIDDIKTSIIGTIEKLKETTKKEKIGNYIKIKNSKNSALNDYEICGVKKDRTFISTIANVNGENLNTYKIVLPEEFAYSNRINIGSIAMRYNSPCLVSTSYTVFEITNKDKMLPEYLSLWFLRDEFCHYAFYYSYGSVKDELSFEELSEMEIPIPSIDVQKSIIKLLHTYKRRNEFFNVLKEKMYDICPILIKGSVMEANNE